MKSRILYLLLCVFLTTFAYGKDGKHKENRRSSQVAKKKVAKKNQNKLVDQTSGKIPIPATSTSPALKVFFTKQGTGATTLVLLHGFLTDHNVWQCQAPLSSQFTLVALDLRGFGQSDKVGPYTLQNYTNDLSAVLDYLRTHFGINKPVIVGYSHGAIVGLNFAATSPNKLSKLITTHGTPVPINKNCPGGVPLAQNAWCFGKDPAFIPTVAAALRADITVGAGLFLAPAFQLETCTQLASVLTGLPQPAQVTDGNTAADVLEQFYPPIDLRNIMANIKVNVLIIGGCEDGLFAPGSQFFMRQNIPNSQIVMFPRAHDTLLLSVAEYNSLVSDFVLGNPITENVACPALNGPCDTCF